MDLENSVYGQSYIIKNLITNKLIREESDK